MSKWGRGYFEGGNISTGGDERSGRISRNTHDMLLGRGIGVRPGPDHPGTAHDLKNEGFFLWLVTVVALVGLVLKSFFQYQNLGELPVANGAIAVGMLTLALFGSRTPSIFIVNIGTVALFALFKEASAVIVNSVAVSCMLALFAYAPVFESVYNRGFQKKCRVEASAFIRDLALLLMYIAVVASYFYWLESIVDYKCLIVSPRVFQLLSAFLIMLGLVLTQVDGLKESFFASLCHYGNRHNPEAMEAGLLGSAIVWALVLVFLYPGLLTFWEWEFPIGRDKFDTPESRQEWARPNLPNNWHLLYVGVLIFISTSVFAGRRAIGFMLRTLAVLSGLWIIGALVTFLSLIISNNYSP